MTPKYILTLQAPSPSPPPHNTPTDYASRLSHSIDELILQGRLAALIAELEALAARLAAIERSGFAGSCFTDEEEENLWDRIVEKLVEVGEILEEIDVFYADGGGGGGEGGGFW